MKRVHRSNASINTPEEDDDDEEEEDGPVVLLG